jgi:hypothetical protein
MRKILCVLAGFLMIGMVTASASVLTLSGAVANGKI